MLEKINKIAPYLALALLGYLCYTVMSPAAVPAGKEKEPPAISQQMLEPALLTPEAHASPVNRDPFNVRWASYLANAGQGALTGEEGAGDPSSGSLYSFDPDQGPPPLPSGLKAVLLAQGTQLVVVGDKLCKPGEPVSGNDPNRSWVVERVDADGVVLRFGELRRKIGLASPCKTDAKATSAPSGEDMR